MRNIINALETNAINAINAAINNSANSNVNCDLNGNNQCKTTRKTTKTAGNNVKEVPIVDSTSAMTELPAWMQKAMMKNGRIFFKGSKVGIKIGELQDNSYTLGEMIKIIQACQEVLTPEQINLEKKPIPAALRRGFVCIAFARSEEGAAADREFAVILYNNGWVEYWSGNRHVTFKLTDCLSFTYDYKYAIDDIDKTVLDSSLLENENWAMCAILSGEERVTMNLKRHNTAASLETYQDADKASSMSSMSSTSNACESVEADKKRQKLEPVTVARIPNPEERLFAQEREQEIQSIISAAYSSLTEKQAEVFKLHFDYEIPLSDVSKMLNIASSTCTNRLKGIQDKFREQIEYQTGKKVRQYLGIQNRSLKSRNRASSKAKQDAVK